MVNDKKYIMLQNGRVKALKNFGTIKKGSLGGIIDSYDNLSQQGNCWVYKNARIKDKALVTHNARVMGYSIVHDHAVVSDETKLSGRVKIGGYTTVYESIAISGSFSANGYTYFCGYEKLDYNDDVMITDNEIISVKHTFMDITKQIIDVNVKRQSALINVLEDAGLI